MQRTNPTAIVTGGSQGIGLAIAIKLAQHNYQVIIADLTDVKEDALKELSSLMPKPHFIHCDISKEKDVMQLVYQTQQQFNGVDVLVNNAGISK